MQINEVLKVFTFQPNDFVVFVTNARTTAELEDFARVLKIQRPQFSFIVTAEDGIKEIKVIREAPK